jgi:2Fe-2S ferredoxin
MPKIVFKKGANFTEVDASVGETLLSAAARSGVSLFGGCAGAGVCGTCLVLIEDAFADKLNDLSDDELDLLDAIVTPGECCYRLACQVTISSELDGMVVTIPDQRR